MAFYPWQMERLADHSVIALATFQPVEAAGSKLGSIACRQLLEYMTHQLGLVGTLCEQQFPYVFSTANTCYYVSFSHSQNHVAVLLSRYRQLGIDIEAKPISTNLVARYFGKNEKHWLNSLSDERQAIARTLLWTLKESVIKSGILTHNSNTPLLIAGIRHDMAVLLGKDSLEKLLKTPAKTALWQQVCVNSGWLGFNPNAACAFVIWQDGQGLP